MPSSISDLDTPCVLIDLDRVEANLQRAQDHANANGYALRPHIKTHKLPRFAKRQVELGAVGITCRSSARPRSWPTPASPISSSPTTSSARESSRGSRRSTTASRSRHRRQPRHRRGLCRDLHRRRKPLTVLVECDTGTARCGVQTPAQALALARQIAMAPGLRFGGLMTYPPKGRADEAEAWLREATDLLAQAGIAVPRVTSGNTPDMWRTGQSVVTERRPGHLHLLRPHAGRGRRRDVGRLRADRARDRGQPPDGDPRRHRRRLEVAEQRPRRARAGLRRARRAPTHVLKFVNEEHGVIEMDGAVRHAARRRPRAHHSQPCLRRDQSLRRGASDQRRQGGRDGSGCGERTSRLMAGASGKTDLVARERDGIPAALGIEAPRYSLTLTNHGDERAREVHARLFGPGAGQRRAPTSAAARSSASSPTTARSRRPPASCSRPAQSWTVDIGKLDYPIRHWTDGATTGFVIRADGIDASPRMTIPTRHAALDRTAPPRHRWCCRCPPSRRCRSPSCRGRKSVAVTGRRTVPRGLGVKSARGRAAADLRSS